MLINSALTAVFIIYIYLIALIIISVCSAVSLITLITFIIIIIFHAGLTVMHNSQLMKKKNTILLQICLQKQSAYSVLKKRTEFWQKINIEFVCEAKWSYNSLKHHVKSLIKKRKQYLVSLVINDENLEINLIRILNVWIEMMKENKAKK